MALAILVATLCLLASLILAAASRCPLLTALKLSFSSWAEQTRLDAGELS
jgi:hypothetical protein